MGARSSFPRFLRAVIRNDQLIIGLLALAAGTAVGAAVIGFRELIDFIQHTGFGPERPGEGGWWRVLVVPVVGGLLVGLFYRTIMPGGRPQGVGHVIEANAYNRARMSLKKGLGAAFGSALSIGVGASVGREGPAVHLGASLSAWLAETLNLSAAQSRNLLGCGAAAAVAASFNAPLAGALFAHEVILGHYALNALTPVVIASVSASVVTTAWFGTEAAFSIPAYALHSPLEFPLVLGLGLLSGIAAVSMMGAITAVEDGMKRLGLPQVWRPALGGLIIGLTALAFPQVLGLGYEVTDDTLRGLLPLGLLATLVVVKVLATGVSLGCGFGGGVFSPSLTVGALLGGAFGLAAATFLPGGEDLSKEAYALIGMGAVSAAVLGAPISTTLIIFELSNDYRLTIAVMVAAVVASIFSRQVTGEQNFFHLQLQRMGVTLKGGQAAWVLRATTVREVMLGDAAKVPASMGIAEVRRTLQATPYGKLFVVTEGDILFGTITLADLDELAFEKDHDPLITAHDIAVRNPPALLGDDSLEQAVVTLVAWGIEDVAVVEDLDSRRLIGCVHESELLLAYNRTLFRAGVEERGENREGTPF